MYKTEIAFFALISAILNSVLVFFIVQGKHGNKINKPFYFFDLINSYSSVFIISALFSSEVVS